MIARMAAALLAVVTSVGLTTEARAQSQVDRRRRVLPPTPARDWRSDWQPEEGFILSRDSEGYRLPTAIAVVPDPGPGPKDPRYFVTELRGVVKVVTNDRTVYTFANDFFRLTPQLEIPAIEGEVGLAGICLDAARGYVFVTFAEQDSTGALRNGMVRFQSTPRTFSLQPTGTVDFRRVFANATAAVSHQIGGCQVSGGDVYVSVGDGLQSDRSQDTTSVLGKVLRMTVDGEPSRSNPFYTERSTALSRASYVWAYGLRNPFGIKVVDDRVFVADNGNNIDRFLHIRAGENYLWDGTDLSVGSRADVVISPSIGPAQLDYARADDHLSPFPEAQRGNFLVAVSQPLRTGIMRIPYGLGALRVVSPPRYLLRYAGDRFQVIAGLALGRDGLYVAPMMPLDGETASVLRLHYAPDSARRVPRTAASPLALIEAGGCLGCHSLPDMPGGTFGPRLDPDSLRSRLEERLATDRYRQVVARLDSVTAEPMASWRDERAAVLTASGAERQLLWTTFKILEPRFDNPLSAMRKAGMSETDARTIARFLLDLDSPARKAEGPGVAQRVMQTVRSRMPHPLRLRHLAVFGALSFAVGWGWAAWLGRRRRQREG